MEKNDLGELIYNHYENYLGTMSDRKVYKNVHCDSTIQILFYKNVFKDCITFASFGLSKYNSENCDKNEIVLIVDDDFYTSASILANILFFFIINKKNIFSGTFVKGLQNINKDFCLLHKKNALYFTDGCILPEDFFATCSQVKLLVSFFITNEECEYIEKNGNIKFEQLLESKKCDVLDLNRPSIC